MKTSSGEAVAHPEVWVVAADVPSNVNVFVKSLHLLALAWIATVTGVWIALEPNRAPGLDVILRAVLPTVALESFALLFDQWTARFGGRARVHASEWVRALQWNIVPVMFLMLAAAAM